MRLTPAAWASAAGLTAVALLLGQHAVSRPEVATGTSILRADAGQELVVSGARVVVLEARSTDQVLVEGEVDYSLESDGSDESSDEGDGLVPLTTTGRWLVLRVAVAGENAPTDQVSYVWVDDEGVRYQLSERVDRDIDDAQPGEWWHEDITFEVPAEAADGGTLRVEPEGVSREVPMQVGDIRVADVERVESVEPAALSPGRS
ncbi:hypothetical protein C8046_13985 [Serinibacter arcticus]|uniref:DUF4352 domain-containing protein n=1 Tax=Serinibacter arcticus TaxID=1655435 RepID=A0A2U1ZX79_9MICO|nr:hypothetical protein C8046_13985 [Serinibacter arcticus]